MAWHTGDRVYDTILAVGFLFVGITSIAAWFVDSPYGRFSNTKLGLRINPRLGWFLMEIPSPIVFVLVFLQGRHRGELVPLVFLCVWLIHYGNRAIFFPLSIRAPKGHRQSFGIGLVLIGWLATSLHGYLHSAYISDLGAQYTDAWLTDPRFLIGISIYYVFFALNLQTEHITRNLRSKAEVEAGEKVYRIPRGGLFRYVTNAPYFSELMAWLGFAIATWSLAGVFILTLSAANLVPRAFATHRWYRERFEDYPKDRKILIPFVL